MKNQLSALELHYLIKELKSLIGGKIDKIYNPEKNELLIQLHIPNTGKKMLRISVPNFLYITAHKTKQEQPSGFCAYLRRKLANARLRSIDQKEFERIVELVFENKEGKFSLIIELFSKGNIMLLQDNRILSAIEYQKWKERTIKPKEEYIYPKKKYNLLKLTEKELSSLLKESDKESVVKTLAMDLGLGGIFSEEVCFSAKIDKDQPPKNLKDAKGLFNALKSLRDKKIAPSISGSEMMPFALESKESEKTDFSSFNELLDSRLTKAQIEIAESASIKAKNKELEKVRRIIDSQESTIKKLEKKEAEEREKAEAIYNNYQIINDILKQITAAKSKFTHKEIKERLKASKIIKDFNPENKTITVELK